MRWSHLGTDVFLFVLRLGIIHGNGTTPIPYELKIAEGRCRGSVVGCFLHVLLTGIDRGDH